MTKETPADALAKLRRYAVRAQPGDDAHDKRPLNDTVKYYELKALLAGMADALMRHDHDVVGALVTIIDHLAARIADLEEEATQP